ncbi:MAG: amidohydrolase [Melioribacteraceae bacterium]|nr:MAG: amidohydrolase [Melioribacteraceae bacterium]
MKNSIQKLFIAILSLIVISCGVDKPIADTIIINGVVATVDTTNPSAEAIAIKNGKILAVGTNDEILDHQGDSTKVIDAKNNFVMPGFIDSHAHFLGLGKSKMILDLRGANNYDEVVAIVAEAAENSLPGEWITGRGWHQEKWDPSPIENVNGYPFHDQLSAASPRNPVYLTHASGHAIIANAKAMELAGINSSTPNPSGGNIVKDSSGKLTGVFEENAEDLIVDKYEEYRQTLTDEQLRHEKIRAYELAAEECLSKGITSFHDAGSSFEEIDLLKNLIDSNKIPVRLNVMIYENNDSLKVKIKDYHLVGYGNNRLTVRSVKKYVDGALGSRGAWLLSPYSDDSTNTGLNVTPLSELKETAQICLENNLQMNTHAIGDRGNREVLKIYEEAYNKDNEKDLRWRIEHAQHLSNKDIPKFTELGVIAAMQGVHCTSDAVFVPKRLGQYRAKEGAYVWRKLLEAGTIICNGTDAPVEDVSPIASFYSSVTRILSDQTTFYPEQRMTREEALRTYTINGAYAAFEEDIKGSITPGKLADIVILSNDLLNCEDWEITNTQVLTTIVNGKVVYQNQK